MDPKVYYAYINKEQFDVTDFADSIIKYGDIKPLKENSKVRVIFDLGPGSANTEKAIAIGGWMSHKAAGWLPKRHVIFRSDELRIAIADLPIDLYFRHIHQVLLIESSLSPLTLQKVDAPEFDKSLSNSLNNDYDCNAVIAFAKMRKEKIKLGYYADDRRYSKRFLRNSVFMSFFRTMHNVTYEYLQILQNNN